MRYHTLYAPASPDLPDHRAAWRLAMESRLVDDNRCATFEWPFVEIAAPDRDAARAVLAEIRADVARTDWRGTYDAMVAEAAGRG
jgi:hypothetical protein